MHDNMGPKIMTYKHWLTKATEMGQNRKKHKNNWILDWNMLYRDNELKYGLKLFLSTVNTPALSLKHASECRKSAQIRSFLVTFCPYQSILTLNRMLSCSCSIQLSLFFFPALHSYFSFSSPFLSSHSPTYSRHP